ncbi:MAG: DeoR/GlpR family DNA-binding transcription regulator [Anaerolineae bacterium]|nr:DeoR/GlpR family DNA-binding transcription regulator [Anaerolineae bacterium]
MLSAERLLRVTEILHSKDKGIVSASELQEHLGVSATTIRQDLDRLESMGFLKRIRGGAISQQADEEWMPFAARRPVRLQEKQAIGWAAAQLVQDGDVILLDMGTTTPFIARNLTQKKGVTVITNSIAVADESTHVPNVKTIILGGEFTAKERATFGPQLIQELTNYAVDKFFMSAAGFSIKHGITDPSATETQLRRVMTEAAREIILVADSSKWRVDSGHTIVALHNIDKLVVDDNLSADAIQAITSEGVEVLTPASLRKSSVLQHFIQATQAKAETDKENPKE